MAESRARAVSERDERDSAPEETSEELLLRHRLEWLVAQRFWIAPMYVVLESVVALIVTRRFPLQSVALGIALLVANTIYAVALQGRRPSSTRRLATIQPTIDIAIAACAIWLDVEPLDATAYGLFVALILCSFILPRAKWLIVSGLSLIAILMIGDFARVGAAHRWEWAVATVGAATIGFAVGLLNLRRALSVEALRRADARALEAQEVASRNERLAALGELSAVVAHEVRNPLGVIFNGVAALRHRVEQDPESIALLDILQDEASRLNRIVGDMLDLAKTPRPDAIPSSVAVLVEESIQRVFSEADSPIRIERQYANETPHIHIDRRLFGQALVNILENAKHAMARGGVLTLRIGERGTVPRTVCIEITDTGGGMDGETRARAFDPFFTTRVEGTGLGLAIVKRIVDSLHGRIVLDSRVGEGTTVSISLPVESAAGSRAHARAPDAPADVGQRSQ